MAEKKKLRYLGKNIFLVGSEDSGNAIITFQHMYPDGSLETIGLRLNTPYVVGGRDVNGAKIKDWVYESFLTCDFNNNRVKTDGELRSEENAKDEPSLDITLN